MKPITVSTTVDQTIDVYDIDVDVQIGATEVREALAANDVSVSDLTLIVDMLNTFIDDYDLDIDTKISATVAWNAARRVRDLLDDAEDEAIQKKIVEFGRPIRDWWVVEGTS